jgi:hypothetical protein
MLERDQLEEWFPGGDVIILPPSNIPTEVTNTALRRLLTEVGLPESVIGVVEIGPSTDIVRTIAESYQQIGRNPPTGSERLMDLGLVGTRILGIDGHSGEVFAVANGSSIRLLNSSLEIFLRVLGAASTLIEHYISNDWTEGGGPQLGKFGHKLKTHTITLLYDIDPGAAPSAEIAWNLLLDNLIESLT